MHRASIKIYQPPADSLVDSQTGRHYKKKSMSKRLSDIITQSIKIIKNYKNLRVFKHN